MLAIIYGNIDWYGYVSIVISIPLVLFTGFFYIKNRSQRSLTGLSAFAAGLISLCSSILSLATNKATFVTFFLFGAYSSCVHLSILFAFDRLSEKSDLGKYLVYFGYFWSLVTVSTGIALTIMSREMILDNQYDPANVKPLFGFLIISSWVFILIIWILFITAYRKLSVKSRVSIMAFILLITTSSVFVLIPGFVGIKSPGSAIAFYILTNITIVDALLIASFYEKCWLKDVDNVSVSIGSHTSDA
ncbi:hypothetical protein EDC94DRAFT_599356 [Helicostylum pulchrum]|nr:hypothetical protein EDC94DRAFT_599356 [Helicostylum pulchrum]